MQYGLSYFKALDQATAEALIAAQKHRGEEIEIIVGVGDTVPDYLMQLATKVITASGEVLKDRAAELQHVAQDDVASAKDVGL